MDSYIVKVKDELRPCYADGEKAFFHKWEEKSRIVEPSPMIGGHGGGVLKYTLAIVEYESGKVAEVEPSKIRFIDTAAIMEQYDEAFEKQAANAFDKTEVEEIVRVVKELAFDLRKNMTSVTRYVRHVNNGISKDNYWRFLSKHVEYQALAEKAVNNILNCINNNSDLEKIERMRFDRK